MTLILFELNHLLRAKNIILDYKSGWIVLYFCPKRLTIQLFNEFHCSCQALCPLSYSNLKFNSCGEIAQMVKQWTVEFKSKGG